MGTTTIFDGRFNLDRRLAPEHAAYLRAFARIRHVQRDPEICATMADPVREATGLPPGPEGIYFVAGGVYWEDYNHDRSVIGYDEQRGSVWSDERPTVLPGYWCNWAPTKDGLGIEWNGGEKFYSWTEWLQVLIDHFLVPWGYQLTGGVEWWNYGESGATVIRDGKAVEIDAEWHPGMSVYGREDSRSGRAGPWRPARRLSRSGRPVYGTPTLYTHDTTKLGRRRLRSLLGHERRRLGLDPRAMTPLPTFKQQRRR